MSLSAGMKLGPYEITGSLGVGGMGEVYRARDKRLDRDIAIKVLPEEFFEDREKKDRFAREAKLLAAVNHPNIAAIHSFEEVSGRFLLVQELLEGESLREKLGTPLPPKKAVEWGLQVAHGLAAAHEKGIVHRDLKPENLFVTKDGRIKILDFGVAKLTLPLHPATPLTETPTVARDTEPGVVMGTVSYMSPEQVLGTPLDPRSDLFSLGVVLYEMLSGKKPFQKDTAPETMAAILREEPPDLADTKSLVPPGLALILRHCLEKEPGSRFQSARDVAFALESLSQATTATTPMAPALRGKRRLVVAAVGIALVAAAAAGFFTWGERAGRVPAPSFRRLTFKRGMITGARFAPDGRTVVYSAKWDGKPSAVYSVRLDAFDPVSSGYSGANLLAISSKAQLALSIQRRPSLTWFSPGTLALAPFAWGTPRELDPDVGFADFSGDGETLAVARGDFGNVRLEYPPGTPLFTSDNYLSHVRISSSGDYVAFLDHTKPGEDFGFVVVVDRKGKTILRKGPYATLEGLAWSPRGDEVWFAGDPVGIHSDLRAVGLGGRERVLLTSPAPMILQDVAPDGRVLASTFEFPIRLFYSGPADAAEREISGQGDSMSPAISPDGTSVAFLDVSGSGVGRTYLGSSSGAPPVMLGPGWPARFSPDGRTLVVVQREVPAVVLHPAGAGQPTTIRLDGFEFGNPRGAGVFRDGQAIWFSASHASRPERIWEVPVSGGNPRPLTPEGVKGFLTNDGAWVVSFAGLQMRIQSVEGGEVRPVNGVLEGEEVAAWGAGGKPIFVYCPRKNATTVYRLDPKTGAREFFREIRPVDTTGVEEIYLVMTPDGKAYAYHLWQWLTVLHLIEGLR